MCRSVCTHTCVGVHLRLTRAREEYLNNGLINIRSWFIGFEAFLPFVGKHKTVKGSWQSGRVVLLSGSRRKERKSTLTLTGGHRKCFWIKLEWHERLVCLSQRRGHK